MVIIGGTVSITGDYITQPIKTAIRKYSLNLVNKDSTIITSKLKEKAGIIKQHVPVVINKENKVIQENAKQKDAPVFLVKDKKETNGRQQGLF